MPAAVGVLFCDQVDSTRLLTSLGDATAEELRRDLFAVLGRAVAVTRGDLVKNTGDGLMVVFRGDVTDTVSCAVLMQRGVARLAARDTSVSVGLRVGLSRGDAIFDGGDWYGAAVNLAARLCAAAASGGILAGERLIMEADAGLVWEEGRLLDLKGFPEPVMARELVWERPSVGHGLVLQPELDVDGRGPLLGRHDKVDALASAWQRARSGERLLRLVGGEAGIGVTRVLAELAARVGESGTVLFGTCGTGTPALAQMVRWWAASRTRAELEIDARGVSDALAARIPLVRLRLGVPEAPLASSAGPLEAYEVLLGRVAATNPLLVVFDDVQLADADEIELISDFALAALPASCLIVIGYRTNEGVPEGRVGELLDKLAGVVGVDTIRLDPLSTGDVEAWVTAELPANDERARREVAALIAAETAGFPAAIVGVIDALSAGGSTRRRAAISVSDVVAAMAVACPYKGLVAYDGDDRDRFFGRDELVDELVEQVHSGGFVTVVGPSGSGKSSVVRAGLLPKLREGALGGTWDTITLSPGARPMDALNAALARRSDATGSVVVFVDQFEECFTVCDDADERASFFDALVNRASNEQPVIIALRGDYYGHLAEHPGLSHAAEANTVLVGPMRDHELRAAITGPAAAAGLAVEPGLCDIVVGDVEGRSGALPLLSHALLETWRRRRSRTLTLDAYREVGGVTAAIARTADRVFEQLDGRQQEIARRLCLRLTAVGDATEDTRRRVPRSELTGLDADADAVDTVIDVFTQARLVTTDETSIEFAHEALLREWPRLQSWLDDDREELRVVARLQTAVADWHKGGRSEIDLYRGLHLDAATQVDARHLSATEQAFLAASMEHRNTERTRQRRAHRRLQRLVASLAVVLAVAVIAAVFAVHQSSQARQQKGLANQSAAQAQQEAARADTERDAATASERRATALALAAQAENLRSTNPALALALAAESSVATDAPLAEARTALVDTRVAFGERVWQPVGTPLEHADAVSSVAFSPDGELLASSGHDGTVRLWNPATGIPVLAPLTSAGGSVNGVAFSPDGKLLAAGRGDGSVHLWDPATGQRVRQPLAGDSEKPVYGVVFSSNGKLLADGSKVQLWDPATGQQIGEPLFSFFEGTRVKDGQGVLTQDDVAFSPDGKLVAGVGVEAEGGQTTQNFTFVGTLRVIDASTGTGIGNAVTFGDIAPTAVAYTPDGTLLAVGGDDGAVRLINAADGAPSGKLLTGHAGTVVDLAFSPDGTMLASAGDDASVRLWDPVTGDAIGRPLTGHARGVTAVAFSPDGETLASSSDDHTVRLWEVGRGEPVGTALTGHGSKVARVEFSPDGRLVASGSFDGTMRLWDTAKGSPVGVLETDRVAGVLALAFTPDGKRVASVSNDTVLQWWDPISASEVGKPSESHLGVLGAAFGSDVDQVAVARADRTVWMLDASTGAQVGPPLKAHDGPVKAVAFSPDGKLLASAGDDATVRLWDLAKHAPVLLPVLSGHAGSVNALAFSRDGKLLASGGDDGTIRLWDPATGNAVGSPLSGHRGPVNAVSFSADGTLLASAGWDGTVRIWDPSTNDAVGGPLAGQIDQMLTVAFSPVGNLLASADSKGTVWLWDVLENTSACALATPYVTLREIEHYLPSGPTICTKVRPD